MPEQTPIVQAEGFLRKIIQLAESPVQDENKRAQIQRLAEKTLALLPNISQSTSIITGE